MIFKNTLAVLALAILGLSTASASAAILAGDVLKLDLHNSGDGDGGSLADWNQLSADGSVGVGSVIRHGDGAVVTGVDITTAGIDGGNNDPRASGWGGIGTDPYYIAAADDIVFSSNGSSLSVTFSGLDDTLIYNVRVYSLITNDGPTPLDISVTDGGGTISNTGLSRQTLYDSVPLSSDLVFSGVSTDGSGNIVASIFSTAPFSAEAVVLEAAAVPEPSSIAMAALGLIGLTGWSIRRRRKG